MNPVYCTERVAEYHRQEWLRGGPPSLKHLLLHGATAEREEEKEEGRMWLGLFPTPPGGLHAVRPHGGWPHIQIPGESLCKEKLTGMYACMYMYMHETGLVLLSNESANPRR